LNLEKTVIRLRKLKILPVKTRMKIPSKSKSLLSLKKMRIKTIKLNRR